MFEGGWLWILFGFFKASQAFRTCNGRFIAPNDVMERAVAVRSVVMPAASAGQAIGGNGELSCAVEIRAWQVAVKFSHRNTSLKNFNYIRYVNKVPKFQFCLNCSRFLKQMR